jgi:TonB-dependent receptor
MKKLFLKKVLLFILFIISTSVFAQGTLRGVITDSLSQDPLIGASVFLIGTSIGGAVDIEGAYKISGIPEARYNVRISYVGYKTKTVSINIKKSETVTLNIKLIPDVIQGQEIVVSSQAIGQAAAINQQISSNTIINVVSEQKIKELPDANAAEALGRLPGVSIIRSGGEANKIMLRGLNQNLTTITVDGVKLSPTDADSRGVDLSTISQGSLSGIILSKAITSDMEAEAIAGNVNFVTKTAPEKRNIQIDAFGTYGSMDKAYDQYNFLGRYGERFLDNRLGVQFFGNIERKNRSSEAYSIGYDQTLLNNTKYQITDFTITYTPEIRKRYGGKILLDYKTPDDGVIKLNVELNRTERRLSTITRNYPVTSGGITYYFRGVDINTDIKNFSLQGQNYFYNWQLNWNLSYTESNSETPYNYEMNLVEPSSTDANNNVISGMKFVPDEYRRTTSYEVFIPYAINNFSVAYINNAKARTSSNLDFEKTFFFDAKKDYSLWDMTGEFKFGGKYRSKYHRRNTYLGTAMYYNGVTFYDYTKLGDGTIVPKDLARYGYSNLQQSSAGLILMTNFLSSSTRNIYNKYLLNPMIDAGRIRDWYEMNINGVNSKSNRSEYTVDKSETGTNYNLTESVSAGYLMNTLNIGTFATLITGVRIEMDDNKYSAKYTPTEITEFSDFSDTSSTHKETIILPNFHLILKPSDYMNIRFAAFRGLTRPNFNFRLPTYLFGTSSDATGANPFVILSNTNLKNADAWNFEANVQIFSNTIGLFSISAFYKNIKNEVHQLWLVPINNKATTDSLGIVFLKGKVPFSTSYQLTYPYNSDKPTCVWGFEIEHQANLRFLPGLLSNIILSYNLSIVKTETYTPAQEYVTYYTTMPGFPWPIPQTKVRLYEAITRIADSPELFGNISLGYDIGGFSGRISYFYQGEFYNGYSGDGTANNIQKAFGRVDLSLKQNITENISVGLNVNNINNAEEGSYLENSVTGWKLETSSYKYGTTADLWLRVSM